MEDGDFTALFCYPSAGCLRLAVWHSIGRQENGTARTSRSDADSTRWCGPPGSMRRRSRWRSRCLCGGSEAPARMDSLAESADLLIEAQLTTISRDRRHCSATLTAFAAQDGTAIGMARMMQVAATK